MGKSPGFKVYDRHGDYVAACHHGEAAACLMIVYGDGARIKWDHGVTLWTEGSEAFSAQESYDGCAMVMNERRASYQRAAYKRNTGREYPS